METISIMNSSSKSYFELVSDFQLEVLKHEKPHRAMGIAPSRMIYNLSCLWEEMDELRGGHDHEDLVEIADALADLIYFALGYAYQLGLPFDEIFGIVHNANMTKTRGFTKRGIEADAAKPTDWVDPKHLIKELIK